MVTGGAKKEEGFFFPDGPTSRRGQEGSRHAHLGKLVGDFREVGVPRWLLLEGHNHKVLKELPFLPFKQLQL